MNRFFTVCIGLALSAGLSAHAERSAEKSSEGRTPVAQLSSAIPGCVTMPEMKTAEGKGFRIGQPMQFNATKNTTARVTAAGGNIYGLSIKGWPQSSDLFEFTADGIDLVWRNAETDPPLRSAYLLDGKLNGPALITNGMGIYGGYWRVCDFETGEVLLNEEWDLYVDPIYENLTYNPSDGCVYGLAQWLPKGPGLFLVKAYPSDVKNPTIVCTLPYALSSICYNGFADAIYGINHNGDLVSISSTGEVKTVCPIDISSQFHWVSSWITACTFSPQDGLVYFTPMDYDRTALATVNPTTGEANVYAITEDNTQFYSLMTTDAAYKDILIPEKPDFVDAVFDGGSTSGYNVYKMPTALVNGDAITATLTVNVSVDDKPYSTLTAAAGEELKVHYENLSTGTHSFKVTVTNDGHESYPAVSSKYIGYDIPKAPTDVTLTSESVTWTAVTSGIHQGYVPASDIVYEVTVNGELLGSTKETSFALNLPKDIEISLYAAEVVATYVDPNTKETTKSAAAVSNDISYGQPLSIPFTIKPTDEQARICKVIDNGDGWTWQKSPDEDAFRMEAYYQPDGANDDWLILPPFEVKDASKVNTLMFEIAQWSQFSTFDEVEVFIGTEPTAEGMTTCLKETFIPSKSRPLYEFVNLPLNLEAGVYYIGFHLITPTEDALGIYLRNISVEYTGLSGESPAMLTAEEWSVEPGAEGALNATFTVKLPTTNLDGNAIDANAELKATFVGQTTAEVSGKPGETVTATVNTLQGDNQVLFYSEYDGHESLRQNLDVYTGVHIPAAPSNVVVQGFQDLKGAYLSWDPVTEGSDGGYVDPAGVEYCIWAMSQYAWDMFTTTDTEYTYECPADRPVHQATVGVSSQNFVGSNYQIVAGYVYMGTPYTLPIVENFEEAAGGMNLTPWITYLPVGQEAVEFGINFLDRLGDFDYDANIVMYMTGNPGSAGMVGTPFFSTEGMSTVTLGMTLNTGVDFPGLTVYGSCNDLENMVEVGYIAPNPDGEEFTDVYLDLPESLLNQPVVTLYLSTEIEAEDQIMILARLEVDSTTGVAGILDSRTILGGKGSISVNGFAGEEIGIYTLDGVKVNGGNVNGDHATYSLPKGLYIVRVGDRQVKAMVR